MIYKTRAFQSTFKKSNISDNDLILACEEMSNGLIDAQLSDNLYKKRVAMPGKGKSGSYRTIVGAFIKKKYFFLYMFAKSDKSNVNKKEKIALNELAKEFLNFDKKTINQLIANGELIKVENHE